MKRDIRFSEKLLMAGLSFILLFMIVQDWVPLGSLNDVQAIREEHSFNELITVTLINVTQILLLMGLVIIFMGKRYPIWTKLWLIIHPLCIFVGVLTSWWIPYFFGYGAEQKVERYNQMFGDTHSFLPIMNGIVPNTLHILYHFTLLFCIIVLIYISITSSRKKEYYNNSFSENLN
ncbi:hypothetical protein SAMN05421676_105195 [Salinibacillus kushneri]|uniref:Uncharacterized protein n=1 Tax=Salinibacillus kushneri TaxID=237682 RepID=A0A1I0F5X8_9BACI|nr:hypothetical protein [Salinibacillus kushneri]SET52833.1 hypothetical protein SAMN05421676_105195 [Salinibacillus kushneri]